MAGVTRANFCVYLQVGFSFERQWNPPLRQAASC